MQKQIPFGNGSKKSKGKCRSRFPFDKLRGMTNEEAKEKGATGGSRLLLLKQILRCAQDDKS